jgi:hypothetical protein
MLVMALLVWPEMAALLRIGMRSILRLRNGWAAERGELEFADPTRKLIRMHSIRGIHDGFDDLK